jgi:pyridoxine kinase
MASDTLVPDTRVLAIASHVRFTRIRQIKGLHLTCDRSSTGEPFSICDIALTEFGLRYVGNKMATFVMQTMGCDVSAINTVHYSKHASAAYMTSERKNDGAMQATIQHTSK